MDWYKCESCGKSFNEFEMNYREAQIDKKCLCRECREKLAPVNPVIKKGTNA